MAYVTSYADAPTLTPQQKYEIALSEWVEKVREKESAGNDKVIVLDTNNRYSYGCLQFQAATWKGYSRKLGFTGDMMNCDHQRELAKLIIKDDYKAWRNWRTTVLKKGVGLPPVFESI